MAWTKRVFTAPTYAAIVRRCVAISAALGFPKVEGTPTGPGSPPARQIPYLVRPRRVPAGHPLASLGVGGIVILPVDYPGVAELHGRTLAVPATYMGRAVPGGAGTVTIDLSSGRQFDMLTDGDVPEEDL